MNKRQLIEEIDLLASAANRKTQYMTGKDLSHAMGVLKGICDARDLTKEVHLPILDWRDASKDEPAPHFKVLAVCEDGDWCEAYVWPSGEWVDAEGLAITITHWAPITPDLLPSA